MPHPVTKPKREPPLKFVISDFTGEVKLVHKSSTGIHYGLHVTKNGKDVSPSTTLPFRVFKRFGSTNTFAETPSDLGADGLYWLWNSATEDIHFIKRDFTGGISFVFEQKWAGGELSADAARAILLAA